MQKLRESLEKHGNTLLVALSLLLVVSAAAGQLRGRSAVLVTDHNAVSRVKSSPVALLYACAAVPLFLVWLNKRNARKS